MNQDHRTQGQGQGNQKPDQGKQGSMGQTQKPEQERGQKPEQDRGNPSTTERVQPEPNRGQRQEGDNKTGSQQPKF